MRIRASSLAYRVQGAKEVALASLVDNSILNRWILVRKVSLEIHFNFKTPYRSVIHG